MSAAAEAHLCHRTNGSNIWMTPRPFLREACRSIELPLPTLDCAAGTVHESVSADFIDEGQDALDLGQAWYHAGVRFLNPPYGRTCAVCADRIWKSKATRKHTGVGRKARWCTTRGHTSRDISDWVARAATESQDGGPLLVLIPARTGSDWWNDHVVGVAAKVWFIRGRLKFLDADGEPASSGAGFDSALIEYRSTAWWRGRLFQGSRLTRYGVLNRSGALEVAA